MLPFLKWAGGKRWLFDSKQFSVPKLSGSYIEPFLGGGAAFFNALPKESILADSNSRLIELYQVVRDNHEALEKLMRRHAKKHSADYYYTIRSRKCRNPVTRAAQFLYLNRTCWNGLYRENKKGQFNVPVGTKETVLFPNDDFLGWSNALRQATLLSQDFEKTIASAKSGDFLFVDPPYTVRHNMNGFVKYNQTIFAWKDQVRLRDALRDARKRDVSFVLTNADHESITDLYKDFDEPRKLYRHSVIAGKAEFRSRSSELLIAGNF